MPPKYNAGLALFSRSRHSDCIPPPHLLGAILHTPCCATPNNRKIRTLYAARACICIGITSTFQKGRHVFDVPSLLVREAYGSLREPPRLRRGFIEYAGKTRRGFSRIHPFPRVLKGIAGFTFPHLPPAEWPAGSRSSRTPAPRSGPRYSPLPRIPPR